MKKILITGGAGYIGSYLVKELLKLNFKVTIIDNLMFNQNISVENKFNNKLEFIRGDVRDFNRR